MFDDEQDGARAKALIRSPTNVDLRLRDWRLEQERGWGFSDGRWSLFFISILFALHGMGMGRRKVALYMIALWALYASGLDDGIR